MSNSYRPSCSHDSGFSGCSLVASWYAWSAATSRRRYSATRASAKTGSSESGSSERARSTASLGRLEVAAVERDVHLPQLPLGEPRSRDRHDGRERERGDSPAVKSPGARRAGRPAAARTPAAKSAGPVTATKSQS